MKNKIYLLVLLSLCLGAYFLFFYPSTDIKIDNPEVKDERGNAVNIDLNRPRIYSFFQTWCSDCVRETPVLVSFAKENDVDLYIITDEDSTKVNKYKSRWDFEFDVFYSDKKLKDIGIKRYPTIMMFNGTDLIETKLEAISNDDLDKFLNIIDS